MDSAKSFGEWLRRRRKALDLTQGELARRVGCSTITLRKLEAEERRPSKQIAERLADMLQVPAEERAAFLRFARGDPFAAPARSPAVAQAIPSPPPLAAPRHNPPLQLTSFIGRTAEIAQVQQLLSQGRLVTLTGVGGAGKTRLSLEVAAALLDAFPDGIAWVELAPLADPALVPQTIAVALGLHALLDRPVLERLLDYLRLKRLLLLLDNCEHLIQACADLAQTLLQGCPHLKILATSRESLEVAGESVYHLRSLTLPDATLTPSPQTLSHSEAARLFSDRAAAALPGFVVTDENAAAVFAICRQLDGIPLALELAAARVRMMQVEEIARRLAEQDRFKLLTSGSRTASRRHQTLMALIDWSYDLLSNAEQKLFGRTAVFAGGWTLEAAEAVGAGEGVAAGAVLDLLAQLANKSLILVERKPGEETRYRMLETIRHYALNRLTASGEEAAIRREHLRYYLKLIEPGRPDLLGSGEPAWLKHVEQEVANLRAALAWGQTAAVDKADGLRLTRVLIAYWEAGGGRSDEGLTWLKGALAQPEIQNHPREWAAVLLGLGNLFAYRGDFAGAQVQMTQALNLFEKLAEPASVAGVLGRLGWLAREQGDTITARRRLEESVALYRQLNDESGIASSLVTLGEVAIIEENIPWSLELLEQGLALARQTGQTETVGWALNHLGHVAQLQGDYERALQRYGESILVFQEISPLYGGIAEGRVNLGNIGLAQGDGRLAAAYFKGALQLYHDFVHIPAVAWCLAGLAGAAALDAEPARAARLWGAAEAWRQSTGSRPAPASRVNHDRLMTIARAQLGAAAFEAAWADGRRLTLEQAVALALEI